MANLTQIQPGTCLDIAAVVTEAQDPIATNTARGEQRMRRVMVLADGSGNSCKCTFWGQHSNYPMEVGSVLFLHLVRVSDFRGGRSLESNDSSNIDVNPDDSRAFALQRWYMEQSAERNLAVLGEMCILCGTGKLRATKGKHGPFIACSNFFDPQIKCPFTRAIAQETYETE